MNDPSGTDGDSSSQKKNFIYICILFNVFVCVNIS